MEGVRPPPPPQTPPSLPHSCSVVEPVHHPDRLLCDRSRARQAGSRWRNMLVYTASMFLERLVLIIADKVHTTPRIRAGCALGRACSKGVRLRRLCFDAQVVAVTGRNDVFFPNKPASFHAAAANHARLAALFQLAVVLTLGWKPLLLLYLAETAWQCPFHPASAMFITNHGSPQQPDGVSCDVPHTGLTAACAFPPV
jgi:hypothetical protein